MPIFSVKKIVEDPDHKDQKEKMVEIQAKKQSLISGAFHYQADTHRRKRVEDIMNIFGL